MYIKNNSHSHSKNINIPDDYSGNAFGETDNIVFEADVISQDAQHESIPVIDEPSVPSSNSKLIKKRANFLNFKGLDNLFCDDNILLIGLIIFFMLGSNDNNTELLIILIILLIA